MGVIKELLADVPLPDMVEIRQIFPRPKVADIEKEVSAQFERSDISCTIKPGMKIAITSGSRGISNIAQITKAIVEECKKRGAAPFVVAAMGSHGGANAEGQREVLEGYGITEASMGCPIETSMDVQKIGSLDDGTPLVIDKSAAQADGIILVNRIKAHTSFRGKYESGLVKMMAIGLAKQRGAASCHSDGLYRLGVNVERYGLGIHRFAKILFGVAIIENAYEETSRIAALTYDEIPVQEPVLLEESKENLAKFLIDEVDVLIVDEVGKNISGDGMDPNITGRWTVDNIPSGFHCQRIVVLDIAGQSHNNGNGLGLADITTVRAFRKFDREKSYPNVITSTALKNCAIPPMFDSDREAIQAAIKTCTLKDSDSVKVIRIKNTLEMEHILVSRNLAEDMKNISGVEIISSDRQWEFDDQGNLFS